MNVGGATGLAMLAQAARLVASGGARHVLVVAGEDRASGQTRETSTKVLAQVGHADYEVPLGGTVPAYYALLASRYLWTYGLTPEALASLPVQMRAHAARKLGAQFQKPITVADVLDSRPVAEPLRLLDCCPVSDGGAAFVVSAAPTSDRSLVIAGTGQAHLHQHLTALEPGRTGAALAAQRALADAEVGWPDVDVYGIYDSFSITVAMLLEELGLTPPGRAGAYARAGAFEVDGRFPMNTHGGLLSYGHCGVGGGMAHLAEVAAQLRHERGASQVASCDVGYVHADGGVLSAHVAVVLTRGER
jgi:acetyl-CoA acetyltransferase